MATIFSRIASGEISSYKIAEDSDYYAFLDINPLHEGHTLVIPKKETDYVFDLSDSELSGLILFSKKVSAAIEKAVHCKRIGVAIIGLEVPHVHVHLVPMNSMDDINFTRPKLKFTPEEFKATASRIAKELS